MPTFLSQDLNARSRLRVSMDQINLSDELVDLIPETGTYTGVGRWSDHGWRTELSERVDEFGSGITVP